jgi:hypothetical protein
MTERRILGLLGTSFAHNPSIRAAGFGNWVIDVGFGREGVMDETRFENQLNELVKQFGDTGDPRHAKLAELARDAEANRKQLQKSIDTLQELLDYLRICIKYQTFDLEATRRENEYLRKLLEDKDRPQEE